MSKKRGSAAQKLLENALLQGGMFSASQAVACGIPSHHHDRYIASGAWERERRGIFHLKGVHTNSHSELWVLALWFRNRAGQQIGFFSHETALAIFGFGEFTLDHLHLTVPNTFRKSAEIPSEVTLHKTEVATQQLTGHDGLPVTTALQSIVSLMSEDRVDEVLIKRSFLDAKREGHISDRDIKNWPSLDEAISSKLIAWTKKHEK